MKRQFVSGFPRALLSLSQEKSSGVEIDFLVLMMCFVFTRRKRAKHKEKENFDPCVCAYACLNLVFRVK